MIVSELIEKLQELVEKDSNVKNYPIMRRCGKHDEYTCRIEYVLNNYFDCINKMDIEELDEDGFRKDDLESNENYIKCVVFN